MTPGPARAPEALGSAAIDHFGIVVRDLQAALAFYRDLGCPVTEPVVRDGQGIAKAYVRFANMQVELIAPTVADSPIRHVLEDHNASDFLKRNPRGGLHHVCYAVADLAATRDHLVRCGYRMLGTGGPVTGGGGTPISFLDPANTDGVLIELKQGGSVAS